MDDYNHIDIEHRFRKDFNYFLEWLENYLDISDEVKEEFISKVIENGYIEDDELIDDNNREIFTYVSLDDGFMIKIE